MILEKHWLCFPQLSAGQPHWPHRELPVLLWDPVSHLRCATVTSAAHTGCVLFHYCSLSAQYIIIPNLSVSSHARQFVLPHSCEALDTQKQNVSAVYELVIKADVVLGFHMDAAENIACIFSKNMTVNSSETTSFA